MFQFKFQALTEVVRRAKFFKKIVDGELQNKVTALLKKARKTLTEALVPDGCVLSTQPVTFGEGKDQTTEQMIALSTYEAADALTTEDLHPAIWTCALKVTSGKQLK